MQTNDSYRSSNWADEFLGPDPIAAKIDELLKELEQLFLQAKSAEQWAELCRLEASLRELEDKHA
jgi:hypothetical protein